MTHFCEKDNNNVGHVNTALWLVSTRQSPTSLHQEWQSLYVDNIKTIMWVYSSLLYLQWNIAPTVPDNYQASRIRKNNEVQKLHNLWYQVDVLVQAIFATPFSTYML